MPHPTGRLLLRRRGVAGRFCTAGCGVNTGLGRAVTSGAGGSPSAE
jgi:hypothetical protein